MRTKICLLAVLLCAAFIPGCRHVHSTHTGTRADHSSLVIVLDGLRPDYVTPELMPHLHSLGQRGVVCRNHHSVFPTVTRVNAASIATGCYPTRHGLMGNSVYFPALSLNTSFDTGSASNLLRINAATDGKLLTTPALGEVLESAGKRLLAVSSGSSGSAFLLNHKLNGGAIIHTELVLPASLQSRVSQILGPVPPDAYPNIERNRRAVDAYLQIRLDEIRPDVTLMWLSDPDHTQHKAGVGAPLTLQAIRLVDAEIGRILRALEQKGLKDQVNIFVTSDHGFSTHTGESDLKALFRKEIDSGNAVIVEGAIYVKDHDENNTRQIVKLLQKTDWVGAIFTRPARAGEPEGFVSGTLSLDLAHWNHLRSADILISANWTDATNQFGYKGTSTQKGVAGHGTTSPYDIHNTLIAAGPDIKMGVVSDVPSGNVDFVPTLCFLQGIRPPDSMQGRVLRELLLDGLSPGAIKVRHFVHRTQAKDGNGEYHLELSRSVVNGTDYLNFTRVRRQMSPRGQDSQP